MGDWLHHACVDRKSETEKGIVNTMVGTFGERDFSPLKLEIENRSAITRGFIRR